MAMKAYKSYKNVDLPWLKRVPEHWEVARNKNFLSEQKAIVGDNFANYSLLSLTLNGVIIRDVNNGKGKFPASFNTYKIVSPGNMVFCLFDIDETPRTVGLSTHYGMITNAYEVLGVHNITPQYLYYYYLQLDNRKALKPLYHGLRKTIPIGTFLQTKLPVPPKEEQDQIVRYLDWQNSCLNKLINAKKKEIALLEEQKQALISQAVTKGLDPHAPLKDSGIDWIGQIPEHWEIKTINNMFTLNEARNRDMKIIDAYQFKFGEIVQKPKLKLTKDLMHTYQDYTIVEPNDIVFNGLNLNYDFVTQRIGIAKNLGIITSSYISIKPRKDINPCFYAYMLKSYDSKKVFNGMGTGIRLTISWKQLKQLRILVPPKSEQQNIVQYLNELTDNFSQLINSTEKQVSLLQEYRTRLVADVVTGQIDVRNIAIPNYETVPETIDQPETAEESAISAEDQ